MLNLVTQFLTGIPTVSYFCSQIMSYLGHVPHKKKNPWLLVTWLQTSDFKRAILLGDVLFDGLPVTLLGFQFLVLDPEKGDLEPIIDRHCPVDHYCAVAHLGHLGLGGRHHLHCYGKTRNMLADITHTFDYPMTC